VITSPTSGDERTHAVEDEDSWLHDGAEPMASDPPISCEAPMDKKKILLVDDSPTVLLLERMILSKDGYEIVTAKDGLEGVEKAQAERPDLILMDVVMPRMDGFEACRKLRERDETRSIPIIMVTTRGELASVETGYASGCNDYVTKPIAALELLAKVRSCLGR
jgi:DNA-binding response OmpR family regulator